jgi:hypothetical protein
MTEQTTPVRRDPGDHDRLIAFIIRQLLERVERLERRLDGDHD